MLHGVDLSTYQRDVNYPELGRAIAFGYAKCTDAKKPDGITWVPFTDDQHETHSLGLRAVGVPTGSYCFGHPSQDPLTSADYFVTHAWFDQLRPCIDMESLNLDHTIPSNAGQWVAMWCLRIEASTGARPIIYASTSYCIELLRQVPALRDRDWWLAQYKDETHQVPPDRLPSVPGLLAARILAAQWTGAGTLPGVAGHVDRDVCPSIEPLYVEVPDLST